MKKSSEKSSRGRAVPTPEVKGRRQPVAASWRTVKLSEVCVSNTGTRDPTQKPDLPFSYVDITSVDNVSKTIIDPKNLLGRDAPSRARQIIRARDVLVSTTRPNLNAVATVPQELDDQIASTGFCVLRGNGEIEGEFLFSFVRTPQFVSNLTELTKGALYPAVTDKQVRTQLISLPPLAEQRRIAARFREQMAAVERARAAVQAQLDAAQKLPAALLRAVFTSPAAQDWPRKPLGEVANLLPSRSIATDGDAEVQTVTTACLTESGFTRAGIKTSRMRADDVAISTIHEGEILIARSNTPELVGRVARFNGEVQGVVASDLTIRILPDESSHGGYLAAYLSFLYLSGYWRERASGASGTMKKITRSQTVALLVPAPTVLVQSLLASRVESELTTATLLRKSLQTRLSEIELLPATLLREAFRGRS